jgi:arylsulfatase A-like enzyme
MSKPHIVLITTDQMRGDSIGCAGHPVIQTPHIDYLARRGMLFQQAYSTTPVCIPARTTLLTGLEGHRLGITSYVEGFEIPVEETLPRLLSRGGYETRVVGKMHVYPERCHYGFDSMLLCEEGRIIGTRLTKPKGYDDYEQWLAERGYSGQAFTHGISSNEYTVTPWHLPDDLHPTEWIAHEACKAIKRRDWTRPLFLWASFTAPHPPLTPLMRDLYMYERESMPKPAMGAWAKRHSIFHQRLVATYGGETRTDKQTDMAYRAYYALITHVDRSIMRIIGTLREENMLENTWIIFTSDHGDSMGDHNLWFKSNFTKGACNIPFIITPPLIGKPDEILGHEWIPGRTNSSPVGLQDIMPTCLDIAGLSIPDGLNGGSLLPLVRQQKYSVRKEILGEFGQAGSRSFMLSDGKWKYIWFEEDDEKLLFHLEEDPNELSDLSLKASDIAETWRIKLADRLSERKNDPAVENGVLKARGHIRDLDEQQKAFMVTHGNPRGLH